LVLVIEGDLSSETEVLKERVDALEDQLIAFLRAAAAFENLERDRRWWDTYNHTFGNFMSPAVLNDSSNLLQRAHILAEEAANRAHGLLSTSAPLLAAANVASDDAPLNTAARAASSPGASIEDSRARLLEVRRKYIEQVDEAEPVSH
jgi:hypothetical protein